NCLSTNDVISASVGNGAAALERGSFIGADSGADPDLQAVRLGTRIEIAKPILNTMPAFLFIGITSSTHIDLITLEVRTSRQEFLFSGDSRLLSLSTREFVRPSRERKQEARVRRSQRTALTPSAKEN